MATLNEIAYAIAHTLGAMNDHVLREKIKYSALNLRALYIRQDLVNNPLNKNYLQSLGAVPIICSDIASECINPTLGIKAGMMVHRTKNKIPQSVRTKGGDSFYSVTSIDKQTVYQEVNPEMINMMSFTKYASLQPKYFHLNDFVYLIDLPNANIKYINIVDVWENPNDVKSVCDIEGECYNDDAQFPIPIDMLPRLERDLLQLYGASKHAEDEEVRVNNN